MKQEDEVTDIGAVATCVEAFEDLETELKTATRAISCNELARLEESLWRQEMLCAKLKRSISSARPDLMTTDHLQESAARLQAQSRIYEKLVARASRSTAVLQHLCSLYRNAAQHPGRAIYGCVSREA